jgi:hypothetical protein
MCVMVCLCCVLVLVASVPNPETFVATEVLFVHPLTVVCGRAHTAAMAVETRRSPNEGRNTWNTTESIATYEAFFVEVVCGRVVGRHVGCAHKARA